MWQEKGAEEWVVEVLREGYVVPFHTAPPLSSSPITHSSYHPQSVKGMALGLEIQALLQKGAVEPASSDPGYFSRMFVVTKASGGWRPIIDLSVLNNFIVKTKFKMETTQSVLRSVRRNDWMVSIDLKDAYLQIPIHPRSRRFLRFVAAGETWQFKSLCFGLTTAPQVFTRVMAPVSNFLHRLGIRIIRYLDDWLILADSLERIVWARDQTLQLCQELGIVVNFVKSHLIPSQVAEYLGVRLDSETFRASPTPKRIEKFFSIAEEFLSSRRQSAKFWGVLLGHLASLILLVPGGRLRMRSLQLILKRSWDFVDEEAQISWDDSARDDLLWWFAEGRLERGTSLDLPIPDQMLWSDASDRGWGATFSDQYRSGVWSVAESLLSINMRELLAVERGLLELRPFLQEGAVAGFSDNTTAISYLRKQGGTLSQSLNEVSQRILRWCEDQNLVLCPQFVMGKNNVVADALSRPDQILGSEWILHQDVFDSLRKRWPAMIDLFATSLSHRCSLYFAPMSDPMAVGTDAMLQPWNDLQAYAFPPFAMIRQVLNKIMSSSNLTLTLIAPFWPAREWFPDLLSLLVEPPVRLPERWDLLRQPHIRRFHQRLSMLQLHAWRLSSGLRGPPDCLLEWLDSLAAVGGSHP